jgi:hypothetical protein
MEEAESWNRQLEPTYPREIETLHGWTNRYGQSSVLCQPSGQKDEGNLMDKIAPAFD